jgi:hypothetical protein
MSSLNETELVNSVHYLEMALRNILGFIPTYYRPPYDDCTGNCPGFLKKMGYHISKCKRTEMSCNITNAFLLAYQNAIDNGMYLWLS